MLTLLFAQSQDGSTSERTPNTWSQQEGTEPESNPSVPQQEEQPHAIEGEHIVGYDPDIDYEGLEPENKPAAQEQKEEDPDAE